MIISPATVPEPEDTPPVLPLGDVTVEWQKVSRTQDGAPVTLRACRVWVNRDSYEDPHGFSRPVFDVHVGPDTTSFAVPVAFFVAGGLYEVEVVAIEESGNQTIGGASFFAIKPRPVTARGIGHRCCAFP